MKRLRVIELGRGAARLCALAAVIGWAAVTWLACPGERRDLVARARWLMRTSRRLVRLLGVRVVTRGRVARGGGLVAANHLGYLDILVLSSITPVVFVAKSEVREWPVFGWLAAAAGTRFIDREARGDVVRVGNELVEAVAAGVAVVVFPEATSTDGVAVLPFKSSLFQPAVDARLRVVPVALGYAVADGRSVATEVAWWGTMTLGPHLVNLATLPWIEARVRWGEEVSTQEGRKKLAEALWSQVVDMKKNEGRRSKIRRRGGIFS